MRLYKNFIFSNSAATGVTLEIIVYLNKNQK